MAYAPKIFAHATYAALSLLRKTPARKLGLPVAAPPDAWIWKKTEEEKAQEAKEVAAKVAEMGLSGPRELLYQPGRTVEEKAAHLVRAKRLNPTWSRPRGRRYRA